MSKWSKYLLLLFIIIISLSKNIWAHGGEDHGDKPQTPQTAVPIAGNLNIRVAATTALEVMLKYPNPLPGSETPVRIFVTDVNTNAPVTGLNIKITLEPEVVKEQAAGNAIANGVVNADVGTLTINGTATEQAGIYQAQIPFTKLGQYKMNVQLSGQNTNAQLYFDKIAVTESLQTGATNAGNPASYTYLIPMVLIIFIAMAGLFFWLRNREETKKDGASLA